MKREELEAELRKLEAEINDGYSSVRLQERPRLASAEVYQRRAQLQRMLASALGSD